MALPKFRARSFQTPTDLAKFVQTEIDLASIVIIVFDGASGKHILYYMVT